MPIYEYRCSACGFQKEFLQRMSDALLTDCPECGKSALEKMVTAAGFQLKGSGWYATDFKNSGAASKKTTEKAFDGGKAESGAADGAKSETAKADNSKSGDKAAGSAKPAESAAKPAASTSGAGASPA